jgi:hypothetical protein
MGAGRIFSRGQTDFQGGGARIFFQGGAGKYCYKLTLKPINNTFQLFPPKFSGGSGRQVSSPLLPPTSAPMLLIVTVVRPQIQGVTSPILYFYSTIDPSGVVAISFPGWEMVHSNTLARRFSSLSIDPQGKFRNYILHRAIPSFHIISS